MSTHQRSAPACDPDTGMLLRTHDGLSVEGPRSALDMVIANHAAQQVIPLSEYARISSL